MFYHHLEVGILPSYFLFSFVLGPFMRTDGELGSSREVIYLFRSKVVEFTCVVFQVKEDSDYPLGLDDTPNATYFCIVPFL